MLNFPVFLATFVTIHEFAVLSAVRSLFTGNGDEQVDYENDAQKCVDIVLVDVQNNFFLKVTTS